MTQESTWRYLARLMVALGTSFIITGAANCSIPVAAGVAVLCGTCFAYGVDANAKMETLVREDR